ncbi:BlaI/MecI/CopY family transcriptional regulator [Streptomyces sp. NBC_00691]|uniref:BlaI/MecI/CopY family transcriptional regulator n=1 Tax=Streptomyces sp. NBC_00691 TaxID=2903671 RepID=UPI002E34A18A|nr:BlaI/MecI/CopY family transcriptional regulator [Streptomyces sp. NBC_00691]
MPGETELTSAYSSKVADDLQRNVAEQERIRGEVARLTAELDELMHDHGVLLSLQQALRTGAPESGRPVPRQNAGKGGRNSGAGKATLVELIRHHLAASDAPCSASDVTTALAERHRDRHIQTTVVRTSLENLVAKGHAHRTKQGSSVFYTATVPAT